MPADSWMTQHGVGPVEVRRLQNGSVEVKEVDGERSETFVLEPDEAADELRPLITEERAQELLTLITTPPSSAESPVGMDRERKRAMAYASVFDSGDIDRQAATLGAIYRHPAPEPAETANQHRFEDLVLGEIAIVIGTDRARLIAETRAAARGDEIPDAVHLPDRSSDVIAAGPPPPMRDGRPVGVIYVEDGIAFGPSGTEIVTDALPGVWFGYETGDEGFPDTVIIVHQRHVATLSKLGSLDGIGDRLHVEGGELVAVDRTVLADPDARRDIDSGGNGIRPHRVLRFGVGGDGTWTAALVEIDGRAVAIVAH